MSSPIQNPVAAAPSSNDDAFWTEIQQGDAEAVVEEVDLSLDLDLSGKGLPWFQISRELEEFLRNSDGVLPRSLNLRQSFLSLDGSSALSKWLDPDPKGASKGNIQSLNLASCSVGRTLDETTSAYRLIDGGCAALGSSGNRLLHLVRSPPTLIAHHHRTFCGKIWFDPGFDTINYSCNSVGRHHHHHH